MKELRELASRRARGGRTDDLSPVAATFVQGLSLGALIGAALAGALLVQRNRDRGPGRRDEPPADPEPPRT